MKNIFIFNLTFYIVIINIFFSSLVFSQTSQTNQTNQNNFSNNFYNFSRERQFISVNLLPNYSVIFPPFVNKAVKNFETFAGLAKIDVSRVAEYIQYLDYVNLKGNFWYIPHISYTFLFNRRIGIEAGIGVQSVTYSLQISKEKAVSLADKLGSDISQYSGVIGGDTTFRASFVHIPTYIGLKIYAGKNYNIVNTFRLGIETAVYNVETENGFTGIKTKRSTANATVYLSYELGWQIDLFPSKNWRVKPYIDFSLFEIGYYVRSAAQGIYEDVKEGVSYFSMGLIDVNRYLPAWGNLPNYVGIVTSLKISIFPRVGITIRF